MKSYPTSINICTVHFIHSWRFPRGVVDAPSLETFKARLGQALGYLI